MNVKPHGVAKVPALILLFLSLTSFAVAKDISKDEKIRFIDMICQGVARTDRCRNSGKLVLDLSIGWIMFESCSVAGELPIMVACFDKASKLAADLTGEQEFLDQHDHCHRFRGDHVEDAIVRCYREGFKYSSFSLKTYQSQGER